MGGFRGQPITPTSDEKKNSTEFYLFTVIHIASWAKVSLLYFNFFPQPLFTIWSVYIFPTIMTNQSSENTFSSSSGAGRRRHWPITPKFGMRD